MAFCLPAQLMKLIEMSPGENTSDDTFKAAWDWTLAAGQTPVKTQDKPGFILNALLVPFNNDVIRAVEAGVAKPADIDKAIKAGLGYRMGPCELLDLIGLDTQVRLCEAFYPITLDPRASAPPLLRVVAAGKLRRKSGRGFYEYDGPWQTGDMTTKLTGRASFFKDDEDFVQNASARADILFSGERSRMDEGGSSYHRTGLDLKRTGRRREENIPGVQHVQAIMMNHPV